MLFTDPVNTCTRNKINFSKCIICVTENFPCHVTCGCATHRQHNSGSPANSAALHPIPKEINFVWEWPKGRRLLFELTFNEAEIFAAFKQLSGQGQPIKLEMRMEVKEDKKTYFSVLLRNEKEEISLKHTNLENYGAD